MARGRTSYPRPHLSPWVIQTVPVNQIELGQKIHQAAVTPSRPTSAPTGPIYIGIKDRIPITHLNCPLPGIQERPQPPKVLGALTAAIRNSKVSASLCLYLNIVTMGSCTPIYSIFNKYFYNEQFKTESIIFSLHTTRYVKVLHTYSLISHPLFQNILFNTTVRPPTKPQKFSTPFQRDLYNPVGPLTSTSNKISNPFQEEFTKRWPGHEPVPQNIDPILGRLYRTLPISTTFPTSNPSHCPNYGSKGIWAFFRRNIADFRILSGARIELLISNYHAFRQHSQVTTKFHSQKFCLLSNSFVKTQIQNKSGSLQYDPLIILT